MDDRNGDPAAVFAESTSAGLTAEANEGKEVAAATVAAPIKNSRRFADIKGLKGQFVYKTVFVYSGSKIGKFTLPRAASTLQL